MHTQIYRDAQRTLRKVKRLDPVHGAASLAEVEDASQALTMYAEHTWGYHSSVYEPWHPQVQMLEVRKQAYAAEASKLAYRALDKALVARQARRRSPPSPALRGDQYGTGRGDAAGRHSAGWLGTRDPEEKFELIDEATGRRRTNWHTRGACRAPRLNRMSPGSCTSIRTKHRMHSPLPGTW